MVASADSYTSDTVASGTPLDLFWAEKSFRIRPFVDICLSYMMEITLAYHKFNLLCNYTEMHKQRKLMQFLALLLYS